MIFQIIHNTMVVSLKTVSKDILVADPSANCMELSIKLDINAYKTFHSQ